MPETTPLQWLKKAELSLLNGQAAEALEYIHNAQEELRTEDE